MTAAPPPGSQPPGSQPPGDQPPGDQPLGETGTVPGDEPGADWGEARSKSVTWYDPAVTAAGGAGLSGLEFMQALVDGHLPPPPIALLLNMRPVKVERGLAVFECTPDESSVPLCSRVSIP